MPLDIEIYRRSISIPMRQHGLVPPQKVRRASVIDIHPENALATLVLVHGYGGSAAQWLYQLRYFGQTICRERLDAYEVPRQIEFRSELPKNFVGKVLRRLLVES